MRLRRIHVGLVFFALMVLAGVIYFADGRSRLEVGPIDREQPGEVKAPTLSGRAEERSAPPATGIDALPDPKEPEDIYFLRTRLEGMSAEHASAVEIVVRAGFPEGATARSLPDASGEALVALDALLRRPHQVARPTTVEVSVDHPAYLPASRRIRLEPDPNEAPRGATWEVALPLTRAGSVSGRVECETDTAAAEVRLYPLRDGRPVHPPVDVCGVDDTGTFRLRVGTDGDYAVIAWEKGRPGGAVRTVMPAGRIVRLRADEHAETEPLTLEAGVAVSGVLRHDGVGVDNARLDFQFSGANTRLVWREQVLDPAAPVTIPAAVLWVDGRPIPAPASAHTKAGGSWRYENIAPGTYRISPGYLPRFDPHPELQESFAWEVSAPSSDNVLDVEGAELSFVVASQGRPLPDAWVEIGTGFNAVGSRTGENGTVEVLLAWDTEYEVVVEAPGHEPAALTVHPRASTWEREVVVDLTPRSPRPSLLVTVTTEDGSPVRDVGLGLLRDGEDEGHPWRTQDHEGGGGTYRMAELEAGRYRLIVRPGGEWWFGSGSFLASDHEVEIPVEGETRIHVTARPAGSLRLEAWDESGACLRATCTLRTLSGGPVLAYFCWEAPNGSRGASSKYLSAKGPSHTHPGLLPGLYRVELAMKGYAPQTHEVELREGEVTSLTVTLKTE